MTSFAILAGASAVIIYFGPKMARTAERLADALGWTHAIAGAVFLGLATSLPGVVVSVSAAARGDPELALSNGLGGIAAQTAFLAVADFFHPKRNLEHDAGSVVNLFQIALLLTLLSCIIVAFITPSVSFWSVHPVSILLPAAWIAGQFVARKTGQNKPWTPSDQKDADDDAADKADGKPESSSKRSLLLRFVLLAAVVGVAGYLLSVHAPVVARTIGVTSSAVGFAFTAVVTSMPELVTTITAVRRGAIALAVGNIAGGNAFDTLFASLADFAYRDGSIYHAAGPHEQLATAVGMVLTGILLMGLVIRERRGIAAIGTDGALILAAYAVGVVLITTLPNGGDDAPTDADRPAAHQLPLPPHLRPGPTLSPRPHPAPPPPNPRGP